MKLAPLVAPLVATGLCAFAATAHAETKRVAVIVGNNAGNEGITPLRYAEVDAGKVSRVLVELGGVAQTDLYLLQGKDLATLDQTLAKAKAKVTAYQKSGLDRVVLIFYYSGHSDGVALELGKDRYSFAALREWLKDTGADVRVGFIDSCKSGALLGTKGGSPGPAFSIRLTDDLSSTGEALLTSSAADENALESREIGGSFFTHHLVSGLRGAADASGDSRVTLSEAYQYAYKHTLATSGATIAGPQHPAYDYQLSGQGELILTELAEPTAALALPDGFDRALVIDAGRDQVIAELGPGAPAQIAVTPGRYGVRAWKKDHVFEGRVAVAANAVRSVRWEDLPEVSLPTTSAKGDDLAVAATSSYEHKLEVEFGFGPRRAVADEIVAVQDIRVGLLYKKKTLSFDFGTWNSSAIRETSAMVLGGYRWVGQAGRFRAWFGAEGGGGFIAQSGGVARSSGVLAAGPSAGAMIGVSSRVQVGITAELPVALLGKDGNIALMPFPAGWLGVAIAP